MPEGPTRLRRLIPALLISQTAVYVATVTPLQLLLALRLTRLATGSAATTAFSVVTGVGALFALVASPIAGRISDLTTLRFGRRRTWILFGTLTGAVALVALGRTTAVWQVVVLWCVVQLLLNFAHAATTALVADQVPPARRGGVSGLLGAVLAVGPLFGVAIANSQTAGGLGQWVIIAVVTAGLGVVAVAMVREQRGSGRTEPFGWRELGRTFWRNPIRYPAFGWAWLVRFLVTCAYATNTYTAFFVMRRFGVSQSAVGGIVLTLSLIGVAMLVLASVLGGYLSDAVGRQKPFVLAAAGMAAVALVGMALAPSLPYVYLSGGLLGGGAGLFYAVDLALCVRVLPSDADAGKDLAIINLANTLPQSVVPFIAPALLAIGGYAAFYLCLAVVGVLGGLAVLPIPERVTQLATVS